MYRQLPNSSSPNADILFNYDLFLENNPKADDWRNNDPNTYVVLKPGTDVNQFNRKIAGLVKSKNENSNVTLFAQRYSERYLHNQFENGVPSGGRIAYVKLFSLIAIFILINACINFMNLSTAKALRRSKEVGIKKVVDATRRTMVFQFLSESMLMTLLSALATIFLILLLLPFFNELTGKHIVMRPDADLLIGIFGITFLTGLISGSYPSL